MCLFYHLHPLVQLGKETLDVRMNRDLHVCFLKKIQQIIIVLMRSIL
uniref:Uncharacterized protein n=1 Tax=Arundo donax TaxID=35708 RepID=A0A0A8ZSE4_ARUDO